MYDPQEVAKRFSDALNMPISTRVQAIDFWSAAAESYGSAAQLGQQNLDAIRGLEGQLPQGMEEMEINPDALKFHQQYVDYYAAFVGRLHELLLLLKGQTMPEGGLGPVIPWGATEEGALVSQPLLTLENAIIFCKKAFPDGNKPEERVERARYAAIAVRAKETARVLEEMDAES